GGRRLGPLVAAISASASSSSVWTLLGVSGMTFAKGLSAIWLFPACVGGFAINWYVVAPRLRRHSAAAGALTLTEVLAGDPDPRHRHGRRAVVWLASTITLLALMAYVAAQFNGAAKSFLECFEETLPMERETAILVGSLIVVVYTMLGGFWAVSLTDTLQGILMALTALVLPVAALIQVGGIGELWASLSADGDASYLSLSHDWHGVAAVGFVLGWLCISFGYPGQPHVVNRFMALANDVDVRIARRYAMTWAVIVYTGMIILGLCGHVLLKEQPDDNEAMFFAIAQDLFHPVVTGIMLAAVLSAIMSTADSQLLVAASTVSHDLGQGRSKKTSLLQDRLVILGLSAGAILIALWGPKQIFDQVLYAWTAMGAAFAPLLFWVLWRGPLAPWISLLTMSIGFGSAVVIYNAGHWAGFWQVVPYLLSTLVLLSCAGLRQQDAR
ncbi:MAG: sodium/proline symporter, partial [Planctomycetota bacterium]